jgi:hypothetical protein
MNKASSALLATAGVTVGLLGFALPAGAATASGGGGPTPSTSVTQPSFAGGSGGNSQGRNNKAGPYPTKTKSPCPTRTKNPCPPKTKTPCPPKPCQPVVSKPCQPHKDKYGHLTSYRQAPKHVLVCKPKPCPTKAKPCPPKCKKHQPHKHAHPQQRAGIK